MQPAKFDLNFVTVEDARIILFDLEMDAERSNERSALTLLALAKLKKNDAWINATNRMYTTRALMDWISDEFNVKYKPNTRETIRRFTLHQFIQAGLVEENADNKGRPINSPKWNYRLNEQVLRIIQAYGTSAYHSLIQDFKSHVTTWLERQKEQRELRKIPVTLPDGTIKRLSAGGQNILVKAMIEEFCARFVPGGTVLYIGDTSKEEETINAEELKRLNITLPQRGKEPDLIVWDTKNQWLFLMEACSSHGPIDVTRKQELLKLFANRDNLVFVSCFPNRKVMQSYLGTLAWETECWCADTPDHMIHLNGNKFLGPYKISNPTAVNN